MPPCASPPSSRRLVAATRTGFEPILTVTPRDRDRKRLAAALLIIGGVLVLAVIVGFEVVHSMSGGKQQQATQTALAYSRRTMAWNSGPAVASSRVVTLSALDTALQLVHLIGRHDVNTADLIHRYGKDRRVNLVVLHGTFNTLPPDEGVNV